MKVKETRVLAPMGPLAFAYSGGAKKTRRSKVAVRFSGLELDVPEGSQI